MNILILPGDDIGPEITAASRAVLERANALFALDLDFTQREVGVASFERIGTTLPESIVEEALSADAVVLGPCGMTEYAPREKGGINVPGTIRKRLDLYANIRPARSRAGLARALPKLDCLIVRENTEGFYSDRNMFMGSGEFMPTPDLALSVRKITAKASKRIAQVAFEYATRRRRHVTAVGKRHVLQRAIEAAVDAVLADPARRTADLGGSTGTRAFGAAVAGELEKSAQRQAQPA